MLLDSDNLQHFKQWLRDEDLYVFTMNGFPYGSFHRQRVKDQVYAPDWRTKERVEYTLRLTEILAELLPQGMDGGISTSPLSYKPWLKNKSEEEEAFRQGSVNLAEVAYRMAAVEEEQGKELHLDIEPEPDCLIENTRETIDFFEHWLFPVGSDFLAEKFKLSSSEAERMLRNHIRVCYDTCHFAVEYEEPQATLAQFKEAGIKIGKVQISAALKVQLDENEQQRKEIGSRLKAFEEDTYLHQVIERRADGSLYHYNDLGEALPYINAGEAEEWRIHYHVPIFVDQFNELNSTQDDIIRSLKLLQDDEDCHHFEIETYTWEVLPDKLKTDVVDSIEREFRWTLNLLGGKD